MATGVVPHQSDLDVYWLTDLSDQEIEAISPSLENVIIGVAPDFSAYTLALAWATRVKTICSFRHPLIIGSLRWTNEIDFCADALRFEKHPENNLHRQQTAANANAQVSAQMR